MRRLAHRDAALLVAGILALNCLGFALRPQHTATVVVAPAAARVERVSVPVSDRPTALVISDAYSSGSQLAEMSYGCAAAARMAWLCKVAAEPDTGYVSGGPEKRFPLESGSGMSTSLGERISRLATSYDPDVVILDGGRDDLFAPPVTRFEMTASAIAQAHQTWPKARIVFVVPRFLARPGDDLGLDAKTIDLLREASGVKDLVVVDPVAAFIGRDTAGLVSRDGTTPTRAGERALATALADDLQRNGFERTV